MEEPTRAGGQRYGGLAGLLRSQVDSRPDEIACVLVSDGRESDRLTYRELDLRARAVAARMQRTATPGDRALLLFPTCLEFLVSLLACAYSGIVAVPAPEATSGTARLGGIIGDAAPALVLTTAQVAQQPGNYQLGGVGDVIVVADVPAGMADRFRDHEVQPGDAVILQYTSGSTSDPKGVRISHHNVLVNVAQLAAQVPVVPPGERQTIVSWLPLFHDMGMLQLVWSMYGGGLLVLMPPTSFVLRPALWLEMISRYRAQISTAPNFAYQMCVNRVTGEQRDGLDLSSWRAALNGSEPVNVDTLERFGKEFAGVGFSADAFMPCYGLAESTFYVSGTPGANGSLLLSVPALERDGVIRAPEGDEPGRAVVTAGPVAPGIEVRIVDPTSREVCPPGRVGEIWLAGESIASGYWGRSDGRFGAQPTGRTGGTGYLRTRDLGFVHEGELYILGRLDDVIVVDGRNHYPQDIELTVARSHHAVAPGRAVAFRDSVGGRTVVTIVAETNRRVPIASPGAPVEPGQTDAAQIVRAIRSAVSTEHQLPLGSVVLAHPGGVPRTTSGKLQRRRCRELFLAGELALW